MADQDANVIANRDEPIPVISITDSSNPMTPTTPATPPSRARSFSSPRNRLEQLRNSDPKRADSPSTVQDRLLNLLLSQIIPSEDASTSEQPDRRSRKDANRPGFSLPLMSNNFRRFNARVGVLFVLQIRLTRLFTWRTPSHTFSFLAIYTFICLDPYLLAVVPLALCIFYIMIPAFLARHPPPPNPTPHSLLESPFLGGPPLAPAPKIKPAPDLSKDFFRNMRDLQNSMEDFSRIHDFTISHVLPPFNFADEKISSTLFALLTFLCATMFITAHHLPWRLLALLTGWTAILSQHPTIQAAFEAPENQKALQREEQEALGHFRSFASSDTLLDPEPENREVEIFEIQHLSPLPGAAEWEAYCFSPAPWDPMSPARLAGERGPRGSRLFEDVQAPKGWRWAGKKWTLDLMAREWVGERCITGVEVEMEGERWVVDVVGEGEGDGASVKGSLRGSERAVSFEGSRRVGEWRRRRWVRVVERVVCEGNAKDEKG